MLIKQDGWKHKTRQIKDKVAVMAEDIIRSKFKTKKELD